MLTHEEKIIAINRWGEHKRISSFRGESRAFIEKVDQLFKIILNIGTNNDINNWYDTNFAKEFPQLWIEIVDRYGDNVDQTHSRYFRYQTQTLMTIQQLRKLDKTREQIKDDLVKLAEARDGIEDLIECKARELLILDREIERSIKQN